MLIVGYCLKMVYPNPCAKMPLLISQAEVTPIFVYALTYVTLERAVSTYLGTRIRGIFTVPMTEESMWSPRYIEEIWFFKLAG
jgi:hypothetical protein